MNQITKLNLESRTRELKIAGESERTIASILSSEANQKITQSSVHRYLANNTKVTQQAIEANDKLKVKVAESSLDVIKEALMILSNIKAEIRDARNFGGDPARMGSLYSQWTKALVLASELLGKIDRAPVTNNQFYLEYTVLKALVIGTLCPACRAAVKTKLKESD